MFFIKNRPGQDLTGRLRRIERAFSNNISLTGGISCTRQPLLKRMVSQANTAAVANIMLLNTIRHIPTDVSSCPTIVSSLLARRRIIAITVIGTVISMVMRKLLTGPALKPLFGSLFTSLGTSRFTILSDRCIAIVRMM